MRSAPSVSYPVGRSFFLGYLILVLGAGGMVAVGLGWVYRGSDASAAIAGTVIWCAWCGLAVLKWRRQVSGVLSWRGADLRQAHAEALPKPGEWVWRSAAYVEGVSLSQLERVYDLQHWILLRLQNPDGALTWVWAERWREPDRWDDLRRALMAHAQGTG